MNRKLIICTPVYGRPESSHVSVGYHRAASTLLRHPDISFLSDRMFTNSDLVRSRSRAVRAFLETDATDLLFWDDDVVPRDVNIVHNLLQSEKDVIGIPYPRKVIDWERVADAARDEEEMGELGRQTAQEVEDSGTQWPIRSIDATLDERGMARVHQIGMGFTLIRRRALESLVEAHQELAFDDVVGGRRIPTVAIFQLILRDRMLLSEDYSFCRRWKDLGGDIWVLAAPAGHVGQHVYGALA